MDRPDGVAAHLFSLGWDTTDVDIVNVDIPGETTAAHDLASDSHWDQIHRDMKAGLYQGLGFGTPCETASRARTGPPGPRPLRSVQYIYGLPSSQLTSAELDQVRLGTFFALKTAATALLACQLLIPWFLENPDPAGNPVSLFNLPEWLELASTPGVQCVDFHQCPMGAETAKPTRMLYFLMDLGSLAGRCNHPTRKWTYTDHKSAVRTKWGPHPPLANRLREDGSMATKSAAAYPSEMNRRIARAIAATAPPTLAASPRPIDQFIRAWTKSPSQS